MKIYRTWMMPLCASLAVVAFAIGAAACSDDKKDAGSTAAATAAPTATANPDAAAIEKTVRDAVAAWNAKDAAAFLPFFTDKGVSEIFGGGEPATREEIAAELPGFIGDPPIELRELTGTASGDAGSADVLRVMDPFLEQIRHAMVRQAGAWKIDGEDYVDVKNVPSGTTMINVDESEFAFGVAPADITSANAKGPIGFDIKNVGSQPHELVLVKLPAEGDVQTLLKTEGDVPGLDFVGVTDDIAPGASNRAFVLVKPLEAGRYALVCFLPDTTEGPEGTPHAFKGMVNEFRIP